jgi:hypothetical protein
VVDWLKHMYPNEHWVLVIDSDMLLRKVFRPKDFNASQVGLRVKVLHAVYTLYSIPTARRSLVAMCPVDLLIILSNPFDHAQHSSSELLTGTE